MSWSDLAKISQAFDSIAPKPSTRAMIVTIAFAKSFLEEAGWTKADISEAVKILEETGSLEFEDGSKLININKAGEKE